MTGNRWTVTELRKLTVAELRAIAGEMPNRWASPKNEIVAWVLVHAPQKIPVPIPAPTLKGVGRFPPTSVRIPPSVKVPAQQRADADGRDLTSVVVELLTLYAGGHITLGGS